MPKRKVPGHVNIRNIDLRNLHLNAITQLTKIINVAFRFHYFPRTWKEANVISIPNPQKNPAFPQDRRLISLLVTMGEVVENILYRQIYPALSGHIPDEQFVVLPGRDTTLQLLRFAECVTDKFSEQAYTATVFRDVSKACDTVWTAGFIYKLHAAAIQDLLP
jgi:hypothetical protein